MGKKRGKLPARPDDGPVGPFNNPFAQLAPKPPDAPKREPDATPPPPPPEQSARTVPDRVVVQREKKGRRGKTVTRLVGLARDAERGADWLKDLKSQLGCGGIIEGDDVILLGDVGDRSARLLEAAGVRNVIRGN